jgi:hypothetical protein
MRYGIHVGAERDGIRELRGAVMDILRSGAHMSVMRDALRVLGEGTKVEGLTISGCTVIQEAEQLPRRSPGYQREGD